MKEEYIIHGTHYENLKKILKDGYINNNVKKDYITMLDGGNNKQIFTQLLYKDLPNEKTQIPFWFNCCLILDKKILKDYPFYATYFGGFKDNFTNAFKKDAENIFAKAKGNLKKMPDLKNLKEKIENSMNNNYYKTVSYIHSHEILFNKKISLKKYCKCIIILNNNDVNLISEDLIKLASLLKIPIKQTCGIKGLNKFTDLFEELIK